MERPERDGQASATRRPRTPPSSAYSSVSAWMQVESPSKSAGMFDSLSGLTDMLQLSSQAMPVEEGSGRRAIPGSGFDPFNCTSEVGNATQRGERTADSSFSPQAHRTPHGAEMAGIRAGGDHKGNGIRRGEQAAPEQARGLTTGATTLSNDAGLPEFAWAPEMTQAAHRAHSKTIARGGTLTPPPSQWPAAGGALYGSRGSRTRSNPHGLTLDVEKRVTGGEVEGDYSAGGPDSRYNGSGLKPPEMTYSDTSPSPGPTYANTPANQSSSQTSTDVTTVDEPWMPRTHALRKIIGEIGIEVPVPTQGAVTPVDYYMREISSGGETFSAIASSPESTQHVKDQAEMNSRSGKSEAAQAFRQQEFKDAASPSGAPRPGRRIVML